MFPFPGSIEQRCLPPAIPLRSVLRLRETKRARMQKYRVDLRVRGPAPPCQNRQLHPSLLKWAGVALSVC